MMQSPSASIPFDVLSPAAQHMLEEVESQYSVGNEEKPRQVLRSLPTPMLSDIHAVYEEMRLRNEIKAKAIYERTHDVDRELAEVGRAREDVYHQREQLQRSVQDGFAMLRRTLEERERYLMEAACEFEKLKQLELDEQEAELQAKKVELMKGFHEAEEHMRMPDKFNFIASAAEFDLRLQHYIDMNLHVPGPNIKDTRGINWELHESEVRAIDFDGHVESSGHTHRAPLPPPPMPSHSFSERVHVERVELPPPPGKIAPVEPSAPSYTPPAAYIPPSGKHAPVAAKPSSPGNDGSNAIYINGLAPDTTEDDIIAAFERFGDIKMVNARHIGNGGFAFVFFEDEAGAAASLVNPRVPVKDRTANVLAKQQILSGGGRWL